MGSHGKKYLDASKLVDRERLYAPAEAAMLAKETATVNFDATVEAHLRLGVDPRHADQMVRGTVVLPHGTGKTVRVAVFAQGDKAQEALRAGADEVGAEDLVKRIEAGWLEFDVALATPDSMGMVGRLGKILGRRGLMPNPKAGTITFDLDRAIREVKGGRVEFKVDKAGIVHTAFGRSSFESEALVANLAALVDAINRAKPAGAKGQYFRTPHDRHDDGPGHPGRRPGGPGRGQRGLIARSGQPDRPHHTRRRPPRGASSQLKKTGSPETACARGPRPSGRRSGLDPPDRIGAFETAPGTPASTPRQDQCDHHRGGSAPAYQASRTGAVAGASRSSDRDAPPPRTGRAHEHRRQRCRLRPSGRPCPSSGKHSPAAGR